MRKINLRYPKMYIPDFYIIDLEDEFNFDKYI